MVANELTLVGLLKQAATALTNVDGRLIRSFRQLLTRPGALTAAYQRGERKPYFQPFSLFLIANVIFFALQSMTELRIFSTQLVMDLQHQGWSELAQRLVNARVKTLGTSVEAFQPVFDKAVAANAKTLLVLMVPPMGLLLPLIFFRVKKPLALHIIFSLHFYSFLLVLIGLPLIMVVLAPVVGSDLVGSSMMLPPSMDTVLTATIIIVCTAYLYVAIGSVYRTRGIERLVQTTLLSAIAVAIFYGYGFALFLITLYTA
jgi:hypothetical protein